MQKAPVVKTGMLIRRPVSIVFEAFVDPAITSKFWFTKGSGRLEQGKRVQWDWEMYGHSMHVDVRALEVNKRILIGWSASGAGISVEWQFTARPDDTTFVSIACSGYAGEEEQVVAQALDMAEGFTLVLAGLKAYLEHNVLLNLVADRFPDAAVK